MALALPLLPTAAAVLVVLLRNRPRVVIATALAGLASTLALGVWVAVAQPVFELRWSPVFSLQLAVTDFGRVMVILVPVVAIPIVAYAGGTETNGRPRLLALMLAFVGAMLLLVSAADFLTLLIGWELVGATSWALIGHDWSDVTKARSAREAFVTTRVGDLGLYLAAGLVFAARGSFAFAGLDGIDRPALDAIAAGILLAAAAKSAQLPFSPWLFAAMAGPTPVSALLHSATLVAAGAYLLIRLSPALTAVDWFLPLVAAVGLATALAGGIVASAQSHIKRVLAGSTSAQYGLMFVAVGAASTAAAGAHLIVHALFKSLLFLGAGVAIRASGSTELSRLRLGGRLRIVAILSAIGVLSLAAVPPMGGAWTKERILAAAGSSWGWLSIGTMVAGFLSAFYAMRYQLLVWSCAPGESTDRPPERAGATPDVPASAAVASIALLAFLTALLTVLWLPDSRTVVEAATGGRLYDIGSREFAASLVLVAAAVGVAWVAHRRCWLLALGLPSRARAVASDWLGIPDATTRLVVRPVLFLSTLLSRLDDRVIDGGVKLTAALAALLSRLFARRGEWTFDGVVEAIAQATMHSAAGSRVADDAGIDGAVEQGARGIGVLGTMSRRFQTGLAHHYYIGLVMGVAALAAFLALSLYR